MVRVVGLLVVMLNNVSGCDVVFRVDKLFPDGPPPPDRCPASYFSLGDGTYRLSAAMQPFLAAEADCVADESMAAGNKHTHLAVVDADALGRLFVYATQSGLTDSVWIGLSDLNNPPPTCPILTPSQATYFQWVTDEPLAVPLASPPWATESGMPLPYDPCTHQCVRFLYNDGTLDDRGCGNSQWYFCQCDDYAEDASHF